MDVANDNSTAQEIFHIEHSTAPRPIIGVSPSSDGSDSSQPADQRPTSSTPTDGTSSDASDDLTEDEVIDLFVRGLMEEKGVNVGSEQMQQDLFDDLKNRLLKELDRALIAELPDDKLNQLNEMALRDGQIPAELIANMVTESNLDAADIIGKTMAKFREIYLGEDKGANPGEEELVDFSESVESINSQSDME